MHPKNFAFIVFQSSFSICRSKTKFWTPCTFGEVCELCLTLTSCWSSFLAENGFCLIKLLKSFFIENQNLGRILIHEWKMFLKIRLYSCISFTGKGVRKSISVIIDVKFSNTFSWKNNARIKSNFQEHLTLMNVYPAWVLVFN